MSQIPLSGIREIFEKAQSISDVIRLEFGEPDFDTPAHIKEAACEALNKGATKYTSSFGINELRDAVAEKMVQENKVESSRSNVIITSGATSALSLAVLAVMNPGDEILIPNPGWANYVPISRISGARSVGYPLFEKDDFNVNIDNVRKLITPKTKMILINSPSNPSGGVIQEDDLKALGELSIKHDLLILSDEVYEKFVYDGQKHFSLASLSEFSNRVITVNSFSKTYAMTGWRIGYAVAPEELAEAMGRLNGSTNSCTATMAQYAALAALKGSQNCVTEMVEEFKKRRNVIIDGLSEIRQLRCKPPKGAFYAFVNISKTHTDSLTLSMKFLDRGHVATVPGSAFGSFGEGYIRIAYANSEENLKLALSRIKTVLSS
ncbi:MAG: pyridoxal phosphate-dependent aminotransferase [Nitrososphaerota archaeon]|nr:pyridoxal phosphate-dependent aminotransferase [Nitrososphaerota archaeon]